MPRPKSSSSDAARKKRIGRHIAAARVKKSLKQNELAAAVGVAPQTVCDWEHGRAEPGMKNLVKVAAVTGESVSWFTSDRLSAKKSIEWISKDLGLRLGYSRLVALSHFPDQRLRREIDAIIGAYSSEVGPLPPAAKNRG